MSVIGQARELARVITELIDAMDYTVAAEVSRVYDGTTGFVYAVNQGWVTQVSSEGLDTLKDMHAELTSERFARGVELSRTLVVGDVVEYTPFATTERIRARVIDVPAEIHCGFTFSVQPDVGMPVQVKFNVFWNNYNVVKVA